RPPWLNVRLPGHDPAIHPAVSLLEEGQVANLLDGRGGRLPHLGVQVPIQRISTREPFEDLVVDVLVYGRVTGPRLHRPRAQYAIGVREEVLLLRPIRAFAGQERGVFGQYA